MCYAARKDKKGDEPAILTGAFVFPNGDRYGKLEPILACLCINDIGFASM